LPFSSPFGVKFSINSPYGMRPIDPLCEKGFLTPLFPTFPRVMFFGRFFRPAQIQRSASNLTPFPLFVPRSLFRLFFFAPVCWRGLTPSRDRGASFSHRPPPTKFPFLASACFYAPCSFRSIFPTVPFPSPVNFPSLFLSLSYPSVPLGVGPCVCLLTGLTSWTLQDWRPVATAPFFSPFFSVCRWHQVFFAFFVPPVLLLAVARTL